MERDLARHLIRTAFGTSRELRILLAMLKQHLGEQEYKGYALGIAGAIDEDVRCEWNPRFSDPAVAVWVSWGIFKPHADVLVALQAP